MSALTISGHGPKDQLNAYAIVAAFGGVVLSETRSTHLAPLGPVERLSFECDVPDREFTRCRLALIGADLGFYPPIILSEGGRA
jgi:hypothetical protein